MIEGYDLPGKTRSGAPTPSPHPRSPARRRARQRHPPSTAWILALALFFTYAALQPGVISRDQIGTSAPILSRWPPSPWAKGS